VPLIDQYNFNGLAIQIHAQATGVLAHPHLAMNVPDPAFRILGGGAEVEQTGGAGNLLTEMLPFSATEWECRAKDHQVSDPANMTVFCVAAAVPPGEHRIVSSTSAAPANHPQATATLPPGFVLVGGGAKANWQQTGGPGSLLYASRPGSGQSWFAAAKDHRLPNPTTITAYAIGLSEHFLASLRLRVVRLRSVSDGPARRPWATCGVEDPLMTVISGGAETQWGGSGSLLTASFPSPASGTSSPQNYQWKVRGADHLDPDPATIVAWALALIRA
jgi:hypothetical protein